MSRPARKTLRQLATAGVPSGAPAASPSPSPSLEFPPLATVTALTECLIAGVRRFPGERFDVPADRVHALTAVGHVIPDDFFTAMPAAAAEMWRSRSRVALTAASLVCDDATAARLWSSEGRILSPDGVEATYDAAPVTPDALRVLHLTQYDPGSAVYRYHSAANTAPGIVSAFVRYGYSNPHCHLRQWDGTIHARTVELLAMTADVIHVHMDWRALHHELRYALATHQRAAITYHGSVLPGDEARVLVDHAADARMQAIQFGARPYHARYGVSRYLPIPMPVRDYAMLAEEVTRQDRAAGFRIAHSPTKRSIKGTDVFLRVVEQLHDEGVRIQPVLIEHKDHGDALRLKATCHATFDSFWLGMQGSGLEAACMDQLVIAGDPQAAAEAAALNDGVVPWTFADDADQLRAVLLRAVRDDAFYAAETARVAQYVRRVHDYPVVGRRYLDYLTPEVRRGAADRR